MRIVTDYATICSWWHYHTHDSRRSNPGFPDLVLVRPPCVLFAELKGPHTRVTPEQRAWLAKLREAGAEAYLWRPSDWPEVQQVLAR